jgi:hypothetical protein
VSVGVAVDGTVGGGVSVGVAVGGRVGGGVSVGVAVGGTVGTGVSVKVGVAVAVVSLGATGVRASVRLAAFQVLLAVEIGTRARGEIDAAPPASFASNALEAKLAGVGVRAAKCPHVEVGLGVPGTLFAGAEPYTRVDASGLTAAFVDPEVTPDTNEESSGRIAGAPLVQSGIVVSITLYARAAVTDKRSDDPFPPRV